MLGTEWSVPFFNNWSCATLECVTVKRRIRSTTILCVRRDGKVVMAGDGQVTLGSEVLKASAKKLRRLV